jgi:hypothetical protein
MVTIQFILGLIPWFIVGVLVAKLRNTRQEMSYMRSQINEQVRNAVLTASDLRVQLRTSEWDLAVKERKHKENLRDNRHYYEKFTRYVVFSLFRKYAPGVVQDVSRGYDELKKKLETEFLTNEVRTTVREIEDSTKETLNS